jgi:glycosyltransferase involved in cell wall biosynthesis
VRILHTVEFYEPSVGGAQEVVRQLSEHLVRRGHEVTVATSRLEARAFDQLNGVRIEEFDISGNAVRGISGEVDRYQEFLRQGSFDVMLNYAAQQWATDLAMELVGSIPYAAVMAPCGFSGLFQRPYCSYFAGLPAILRRYDALVFHGRDYRDIDFARRHGLDGLFVIGNGVDKQEFGEPRVGFRDRYRIDADEPLILTVGSHTGLKGHQRLAEAFRRSDLPRATLAILGNPVAGGCQRTCRARAAIQGLVDRRKRTIVDAVPREAVIQAFFEADVFALPSRIECAPAVLYEACAAGTPFVASNVGNAAEIAVVTGAGVIVETTLDSEGYADVSPQLLSKALTDLIRHPDTRAAMGSAGREAWRASFTWDHIASQYEGMYLRAVARRVRT